jgi:hypothetical protein
MNLTLNRVLEDAKVELETLLAKAKVTTTMSLLSSKTLTSMLRDS